MTIDWSDTTLRTLDELAATAFPPEASITKDTLKRRIRQGNLVAYRPGKAFLSSYADVHAMIESLRVRQKAAPLRLHPKPTLPPGITEADLASRALDHALEDARKRRKAREAEKRSVKRKRIS